VLPVINSHFLGDLSVATDGFEAQLGCVLSSLELVNTPNYQSDKSHGKQNRQSLSEKLFLSLESEVLP
jgi:hypothetical protein